MDRKKLKALVKQYLVDRGQLPAQLATRLRVAPFLLESWLYIDLIDDQRLERVIMRRLNCEGYFSVTNTKSGWNKTNSAMLKKINSMQRTQQLKEV